MTRGKMVRRVLSFEKGLSDLILGREEKKKKKKIRKSK